MPSSDAVRRAALSASWARDHRVARRRLALRWLLWAVWRIGLPLVLALALAVWLLWPMRPAGPPAAFTSQPSGVELATPTSPATPSASPSPTCENAANGKES